MNNSIPKNYFNVLGNDMRRQIIRYLSTKKPATFTQIMNLLELDPLWQCGTVGYHLNLLVDSGILRRYEDGYALTSEGRSLAQMIKRIEYIEVEKKLNIHNTPEQVLEKLNARSVCWLLAVAKGVKPAATILSVAEQNWAGLLRVLHELDLCWSYKGIDGMILTCQLDEAERLFGGVSTSSEEETVSLLFDDKNWADFLSGKKPSFMILNSSSAKLTPVIYQVPNVAWEVIVSKDVRGLLRFAQVNQRTDKPSCLDDPPERGRALGYPECCIETFLKEDVWGLSARANFFKELIDLGLDKKMPWEFWAIAHVPHSARCEESLKLGRKYLDAVKSYSASLYDSTLRRLRVSYLPYSVGERFISFREIPQDEFPHELEKECSGMLDWSRKIVSGKAELILGDMQRPLVFYDAEREHPIVYRIVPEMMGLKWIAYSPGEGLWVRDTEKNEVYLYLLLKWVLPNEYERIINTVCRAYKCG